MVALALVTELAYPQVDADHEVLERMHELLDPLPPWERAEAALSCAGVAAGLFREWQLLHQTGEPERALRRIALRLHRQQAQ